MASPHLFSQTAPTERVISFSSADGRSNWGTSGPQPALTSTNNVQVPPGHMGGVASRGMNGKITIDSLLATPPPIVTPPPLRTNAQARTARKSAFRMSPSSRGDSSPSSNNGRKPPPGHISENKERDSLSMSEASGDSPVRTPAKELDNNRQAPKRLPLPLNPQQVQQTQQPPTDTEGSGSKMSAAASSAASALGAGAAAAGAAAAGGAAAAVGTGAAAAAAGAAVGAAPASETPKTSSAKRSSPIILSETISSTKPKRQKVATPKAAALANERFMNADGTAIKKRKPPGTLPVKEIGKGRKKTAIKGSGMFSLRDTIIEPVTGATINVAAKPAPASAHPPRPRNAQQVPVPLPPAYKAPTDRYLQRQPVSKGPEEINSSSIPPGVINLTNESRPCFQPAKLPKPSNKTKAKISNSSLPPSAQNKTQGCSAAEPILITDSSPPSAGKNKDKPSSTEDAKRRGQGMPPRYIPSDSDDSAISLRSPPESGVNSPQSVRTKQWSNTQSHPAGALAVTNKLFEKCVSSGPEERKRLYVGIEDIIQRLEFQMDQCKSEKNRRANHRPPITWSDDRGSPTLDGITALLKRLCVLSDDGSIITFEGWKENASKFKGRFMLPEDSQCSRGLCEGARSQGVSAGGRGQVSEYDATGIPISRTTHGLETSVLQISGDSRRISSFSEGTETDYSVPNTQETENTCEQPIGEEPPGPEGSVDSDVVQLVGSLSSPLNIGGPVLDNEITPDIAPTKGLGEREEQDRLTREEQDRSASGKNLGGVGKGLEEVEEEVEEEAEKEESNQQEQSPGVATESLSPNSQSQTADSPAYTTTFSSPPRDETEPPFVSNKRKKKICGRVTVEDFLSESISDKTLRLHRAVSLLATNQDTDNVYLPRIIRLTTEESRVKAELDTLNASAKAQEAEYNRKIKAASNTASDKLPLANWGEYYKLIGELRDFREDHARKIERLVMKASKIVEERTWCLAQQKVMEENIALALQVGELSDKGTPSETSTATPPASGLVNMDLSSTRFSLPGRDIEEGIMARDLLKDLVPWSKMRPEPPRGPPPPSTEQDDVAIVATMAADTAETKKRIRRKKRLGW